MKRHLFNSSVVFTTIATLTTLVNLWSSIGIVLANPIEDPDNAKWASIRGYNSDQFHQYFNQKKDQGYRVIDLEVDEISGQAKYSAIFQFNNDKRGWASHRDLSHEAFSQKWNEYKDNGYRLIDQEAYQRNNKQYYAGVWVENKENLGWVSYRNITGEEFSQRFDTYSENGFRMIDIESYPTNQGVRYSAVWVKNTDSIGWYVHRDMSSASFSEKFETYSSQGYRLLDFESNHSNNQQKFAGIWVKNSNGRAWKARRGMSAQGYGNFWKTYKDEGYRLIDFESYPTAKGTRYAGVWRQNNNHFDWRAKDEVNKEIKEYRDKFKVPGISVAVMHKGELVYARGFGQADIEQDKVAHAGTIYRVASISKAITSALTLRLVDLGDLSLDDTTRKYVPALPDFHQHSLKQLMKHRSGIRHYKGTDYQKKCDLTVTNKDAWKDSSSTQYSTAEAATELFRDDPLLFEPDNQKCYSTHAYTVLGAALEGATNLSYSQLVERELTQGLRLTTLRPENRSQVNTERASLYQTKSEVSASNKLAQPNNISWKYAGGGLEASSVDLAKFGQAILDDTFLSPASRAETSFSHSGAQLGAHSYLKLNEKEDLVIVVLSNQRVEVEGASPTKLANDIEAIVLKK